MRFNTRKMKFMKFFGYTKYFLFVISLFAGCCQNLNDKTRSSIQPIRYAAYDGRPSDLESELPVYFMPWISENIKSVTHWKGTGSLPAPDRLKIHDIV